MTTQIQVTTTATQVLEVATGAPGAPGRWIRAGAGAPDDTVGRDGDLWIDTSDGDLWERASGEYAVVGNLRGPQGDQGDTGAPGVDGRDVELRATDTHIQWRLAGGDWSDLIALEDLEGPQGPQGDTGPQGDAGPQGEQGSTGPAGAPGADGSDGASAYDIAIANGFVGTESEWLASLQGPPGTDGMGVPDPSSEVDGRMLYTEGGVLVYGDAPSTGASETTVTITDATGDGTFTAPALAHVFRVAFTAACRIRLYRTAAGRTADEERASTTPYPGGRDLLYEYVASGAETDDGPPVPVDRAVGETVIYYHVDGGPSTVTLTIKEA